MRRRPRWLQGDAWVVAVLSILILLPWLNPVVAGPSPSVAGWLLSLAAGAGCLWFWRLGGADARLARGAVYGWLLAAAINTVMGVVQYFDVGAGVGQALGLLRQRNQLASLCAMGLASMLWLTLRWERWRWLCSVALLLAAGEALSTSRTGLVQLFLLCGLVCWWRGPDWRRRLVVCAVAVAGYGVVSLWGPWWLQQLQSVQAPTIWQRVVADNGCGSRRVLWSNVLYLIAQKPWLGWGWGELDYAHYMTLYPGERFCDILDNAHNLPLHLAVELGVPAALLACGAGLWAVWRARPWRETDPTRQLAWSVLAVIFLHSMVEYPLWYGPFQMAVGLCIGMLWRRPAARSGEGEPSVPQPQARRMGWPQAVAALSLAAVAYAAWDYHRISQLYLPPEARDAAYRNDTLAKVRGSWLFRNQVDFAELTTTPLARDNAARQHALAATLLHYSPEPRVIEKLIESAVMLGRDDEALAQMLRFRAAFPADYEAWRKARQIAVPSLSNESPPSPAK